MKSIFYILTTFLFYSHSLIASTYQGKLDILVEDDFIHHHSVTKYFINMNDKSFPINFPSNMDLSSLKRGDDIIINTSENQLLDSLEPIQVQSFKQLATHKLNNTIFSEKNVLTLLIDFSDKKATDTTSISAVENMMYLDEKSMNNVYLSSSFNQLFFISDTDKDNKADIHTVNLNYAVNDTCDAYQWRDDAKAATSQDGVNISDYQYFVLVLPNNVNCGWGGLGNLGCNGNCTSWIKWNATIVYAHELGHNLGMHHASTDLDNDGNLESEYGDHSGVMGNNSQVRQINAPHRYQLGIYEQFPDQFLTAPTNGNYHLSSIELDPSEHNLDHQVIRLSKSSPDNHYYISLRNDIGVFGMHDTYSDKVNIHHYAEGYNRTHFITALTEGETFTDTENNIDIEVIDINTNNATININMAPSLRPEDLVGYFERTPVTNSWHQVNVTYDESSNLLQWTNAADRSWELFIDKMQLSAPNSPYGQQYIQVDTQTNTPNITALWFLGERYERVYHNEQFTGHFNRLPVENAWHDVSIFTDDNQQLWWQNSAGIKWELITEGTRLYTLDSSPYGYRELTPDFDETNEKILGLWFKNEFYQKMPTQD
ncbi:reprolysin-like metallopeptidase [uncultured Shewanella sp.]|uniref:reprolysin-like metallopeptidase n=1 Tax=uncultured Shewanella sp. TaxID=173975 RepID=UPI002616A9FE|nr:hypothetical protein [uncultured Shewanella sp.]